MTRRAIRHKPAIKAIPTKYNGINFRSRLEAKVAAFLDVLRWRAEYEPDLQAGYVMPDFLLPGFNIPTILECKPAITPLELAEYRTALISRMRGWLRTGVEREIARLDADPEQDLALTDQALDDLVVVECGGNPRGHSRRILVVGPSLHLHHDGQGVTIDGEHGFTLCSNGEDADHIGLAPALGAPCLQCGRAATAWMPRDLMFDEWAAAGNPAQWHPVTAE